MGEARTWNDSIIIAVVGLVGVLAGAMITGTVSYVSAERAYNAKLVELGLSILSANPSEAKTPGAREWAISIIERNSGQTFSEAAKEQLAKEPLIVGNAGRGGCRVFEAPKTEILGQTPADQRWIDDTIESGVAACGWPRPKASQVK